MKTATKTLIYTLRDTFSDATISRHRTFAAASSAMDRHLRAVKRANGASSYLTYEIVLPDGRRVKDFEIDDSSNHIYCTY